MKELDAMLKAFRDATDELHWTGPWRCIQIPDGDGFTVANPTLTQRCRLLGIDAPEIADAQGNPKPHAIIARDTLRAWAMNVNLDLASDPIQPVIDCYERHLVWARISGTHLSLNVFQIMLGSARVRYDFPTPYTQLLADLESFTRMRCIGLWALRPRQTTILRPIEIREAQSGA